MCVHCLVAARDKRDFSSFSWMMTKMKSRRFYKRKWWISIDFLAAFSTIIASFIYHIWDRISKHLYCYWLRHTLLPRTFYCLGTLCIVIFCSKEQFASNWLVTVCFLTHFTPQHTLPTGIFFFLKHFTPQPPLLPRTLFSSAQFASQHPLLLITPCSSAQFAAQHTLLLSTLCSSVHFTP